ncbi:MAG: hypothetical protein K1Y36_10340 [Blastocatellia bacterium]|nr:hypothetical protein [Blastocatellia bacterium]
MSKQIPSIGRVVHYFAYGTPNGEFKAGEPRAAMITEVDTPGEPESNVGLVVFNPTGQWFNRSVPFSAENQPGCWNWPAFVPAKS